MKDNYYRIYDQLYDSYPEDFLTLRLASFRGSFLSNQVLEELREFAYQQEYFTGIMRQVILIYEMDNGLKLRPDAKLFLVTNFNQMVVKPLLIAREEKQLNISRESLANNIKNDLLAIIKYSVGIKKESQVSGHEVMRAIDELWGNLESTKFEIWG